MTPRAQACALSAAALAILYVGAADAKTIRIEIAKLVFQPSAAAAQVGDVIEWTNDDAFVHTATAADKSWEVMLPAHGKGSRTVTEPGTVAYFCRFHPNMRGTIEVTAP